MLTDKLYAVPPPKSFKKSKTNQMLQVFKAGTEIGGKLSEEVVLSALPGGESDEV